MNDLIEKLREFSLKTFGPGERTKGVCEHARSELDEIVKSNGELEEWADLIILGIDGAWRCGFTPTEIEQAIQSKLAKNESRLWPDYRNYKVDEPIMHIKTEPVLGFQIGDIIRYNHGPTALMRIDSISHNGSGYRVYGRQCMGGLVGAYLDDIHYSATEEDIETYRANL